MSNEILRIVLVIVLSIGVLTVWNYIRPDLTKKIETQKVEKEIIVKKDKDLPEGIVVTPFYKAFQFINNKVKDVGWTIILMTLIIKIVTLPLSIFGQKTSLKMKEFQKELEGLKKKKLAQEEQTKITMELMKKHKVNPIIGFLPMLIQIPLFYALFTLFRFAPELNGVSFLGFIKDLALPDPFYILPILSVILIALHMFISQGGSNKKLMILMSVISLVFMIHLPGGVQLYILISSLLTLLISTLQKRPA